MGYYWQIHCGCSGIKYTEAVTRPEKYKLFYTNYTGNVSSAHYDAVLAENLTPPKCNAFYERDHKVLSSRTAECQCLREAPEIVTF